MIDHMATKSTFPNKQQAKKKLSKQNEMQILISHTLSLTPIYILLWGNKIYFFFLLLLRLKAKDREKERQIFWTANTCLHASHFLLDRVLFTHTTIPLRVLKLFETEKPTWRYYGTQVEMYGTALILLLERKEKSYGQAKFLVCARVCVCMVFALVGNHEPYLFRFHINIFNTTFVTASKKTKTMKLQMGRERALHDESEYNLSFSLFLCESERYVYHNNSIKLDKE